MIETTFEDVFHFYEFQRTPKIVFSNEEKNILQKNIKTTRELWYAIQVIKRMPEQLPFELKVKSAIYNQKTNLEMDEFLSKNINLGKDFKFSFDRSYTHSESMNEIKVINKNKKIIATLNAFFVFNEKNKLSLIINNIQSGFGSVHQGDRKTQKLNYLEDELTKLNEALGENWRIYFTKKLKEYSALKKIPLIMRLPPRYYLFGPESTLPEYVRQIRQYIQTAIKAGIPVENIDASIVESKIKDRFESNLKNKTKNQEKQKKIIEKKKLREAKPKIHVK